LIVTWRDSDFMIYLFFDPHFIYYYLRFDHLV
jgi:hypothetical protein